MTETFGIAASVSGIVSLGLELSTRIITYINAVQCYDEDIGAIYRQTKTFQSSLDILKKAIPDLSLNYQIAGDTVREALESGKLELEALKNFMEKHTNFPGQPQNLKSNFRHATKKMTFPLHRGNLEVLQQRLDRTNMSLDAATRALGLVIISSIDRSCADALRQLSSISATSTANDATSSTIKASLDTFIPQVDQALLEINNSLRTNLPDIQRCFASMSATIMKQEESLTRRIQEAQVEFRESLRKSPSQTNSLDSVIASLNVTPTANTAVMSEMFGGVNKFSDVLKDLAEKKENDPPYLLDATSEQRALYRLVSSPAKLEKLCTLYHKKDDVEHEFTIMQRAKPKPKLKRSPGYLTSHGFDEERYISNCICPQYSESRRRHTRLGGVSIKILSIICRKHLPECRYSNSEDISKSDSIRLSYDGLRWLLSKAVDISISLNTGPKGLKITPSITIRPAVDETQAPVFRTLAFLRKCVIRYSFYEPENKIMHLLEVVVYRVVQQYISRRSSPYEVNGKGQSVLHLWVDILLILKNWWVHREEQLTAMTKLLLEAGVPILLCDDQGGSPGTKLLKSEVDSVFALKRLMCILCEEAPEPSIFDSYSVGRQHARDLFKTFLRLRNMAEAVDILGFGPLNAAIHIGDEEKVENIITLHSSTIRERNLIHQAPFHLAGDKPRVLRILMAAASSQENDRPDQDGNYALDYALRATSVLCSKGSSWVACSSCPCIECVEIFLDSGWRYRSEFLFRYCNSEMSHTARLFMIDRLVSERAILRTLGQKFLPFDDINRYRLNEPFVLDNHAYRVVELLLRAGIRIPASVRETLNLSATLPPEDRPLQLYPSLSIESYPLYGSVYHNTYTFQDGSCNQLAELLYDKGFRDINQVDTHGHSPLSVYIYSFERMPSHVLWLIEHGANILDPCVVPGLEDPNECIYGAYPMVQLILDCIPGFPRYAMRGAYYFRPRKIPPREIESYSRLVSLVAPMDQSDECHCRCVEAGCHTMKILFARLWQRATGRSRFDYGQTKPIRSTLFPGIAYKISSYLQVFALDLSKWDRVVTLALRYFTFETLELQHTCCGMGWSAKVGWPEEEIVEIEDENREILGLLELLLQDFQMAYNDFEGQNGKGDRFTNFLTARWSPRMQQTLASMEATQLTTDEKQKAEAIGVRWQPALEDSHERKTEDPKYWLERLDEILPV